MISSTVYQLLFVSYKRYEHLELWLTLPTEDGISKAESSTTIVKTATVVWEQLVHSLSNAMVNENCFSLVWRAWISRFPPYS